MSDKIWLWNLWFNQDQKVNTWSTIAMKEFDEVGRYTTEEISQLNKLFENEPLPKFSEDHWIANDQLVEFSKVIKSKLNQKV